ncbi:MAG TPA: hypothetical protein VEO54_23540 [Thermoanaerobaculia bacterium]|nr:hypothetical protein [Thermoanaerobaculia bacterium]
MRRIVLLLLLVALPLVAQLPPGTTRTNFRQYLWAYTLVALPDDSLWALDYWNIQGTRIHPDGTTADFDLPKPWRSVAATAGPDGALWILSAGQIGRVDPQTRAVQRWAVAVGSPFLLSGPDGNLWFGGAGNQVKRMRPDGTMLDSYPIGGPATGAVFGSDGALYLATGTSLVRITIDGQRTEFPAAVSGDLYAGPGFLWNGDRGFLEPGDRAPSATIRKLSLQGETLASYTLDMTSFAADALGNLWLRTTLAGGSDVVAQLSPQGVLTRFGPFPPLPWSECRPRFYGGMVFLSGGRVAMADFYPDIPIPASAPPPCGDPTWKPEFRNTLTIFDPRIVPVISVEALNRTSRRRSVRH